MTINGVGTPAYVPPEISEGQQYDNKCDIWCLGLIIQDICTKKNAFLQGSQEG